MRHPIAAAAMFGASMLAATGARADACRIDQRVIKIVAEEYGKKPGQVSPRDKFAVDGRNTIEDVEIKLGVEQAFKVKIADADWAKLVLVRDIVDYLKRQLKSCG
ncbi:MAG: hypothetical protein ACHQAY_12655 [Hyphomicrobiales bacterium]